MNTPKIRFKGFEDDWEQRKVGEVTKELLDYDNFSSGLPLLTSSRSGLMYQSEYRGNATTENENTLFSVVPLNACTYRHMSDDSTFHLNINTLEKGLVSKEYPVFQENESNLKFIVQYINSSNSFTKFCTEQKKGGTRTRLYYKTFCEYKLMMPSIKEQNKTANFFDTLDHLITLHQRKCDETKQLKKFMLQKMFPKNGEKNPEIRFEGFTDDWEQRKFGDYNDLMTGYPFESDKFSEDGIKLVRGMNVKRGYLDFSGDICVKWNSCVGLENFLLKDGDILIQMDGALIGKSYAKIKENQLPALLVQRVTRARTNNKFASQDFMYQTIQRDFLRYIEMNKTETAVPHLSLNDIRNFEIMVPCLAEQKKIGEYFDSLDNLITLHQRKCEKLKELKKFMLQNMFV